MTEAWLRSRSKFLSERPTIKIIFLCFRTLLEFGPKLLTKDALENFNKGTLTEQQIDMLLNTTFSDDDSSTPTHELDQPRSIQIDQAKSPQNTESEKDSDSDENGIFHGDTTKHYKRITSESESDCGSTQNSEKSFDSTTELTSVTSNSSSNGENDFNNSVELTPDSSNMFDEIIPSSETKDSENLAKTSGFIQGHSDVESEDEPTPFDQSFIDNSDSFEQGSTYNFPEGLISGDCGEEAGRRENRVLFLNALEAKYAK